MIEFDDMVTYELDTSAIAVTDDYQMVLPIGKFHTRKYGEMEITRDFAEDLVRNWQNRVLGERDVFVDSQHQQDQSYGWIRDLQVRDDGVYAKVEWTELGQDAVGKGIYRYFSAAIGAHVDIKTGERIYPVLHTVSLTNTPVMYTMRPVHLSETVDNPAHGDGIETNIEEESMKTLAEIKDALFALSDDERGELTDNEREEIALALGIELADPKRIEELEAKLSADHDKMETLIAENTELSEQVTEYRKAEREAKRAVVIEAALSEGKILPKNRERWERLYDSDPEGTTELLAEKAREIDYDKDGTSRADEKAYSEDIVALAEARGIDPAEAAELIASVTGEED